MSRFFINNFCTFCSNFERNPFLKVKSEALEPDWLIAAGAYPGFRSMKRLGVFLLPLDGMLVHRKSLPAIC